MSRRAAFLVGLGLVTGATLSLEVLDTRLLSVVTWYSLAFLVIAMGLFGLTAGAVSVYLRSEDYTPEKLSAALARDCMQMSVAIPVSYVLLLIIPLRVAPVATTAALFVAFAAAIALPFYPAGRIVAAAVTRARFPIGQLYAVDLVGAALGAPLVPPLLRWLGGGSAILAMAAVAALAAACFAWSAEDRGALRRAISLAAAMTALTAVNAVTRYGLEPLWVKGGPQIHEALQAQLWNSHSRIDVAYPQQSQAALWGPGTRCPPAVVWQRMLVIDGTAGTPLYSAAGGFETLRFLECDVTNAVHAIREKGPQAIIGVGGSRDLQAALLAKHRPVVGIELNDRILEVLRGPLGAATGVAFDADVLLVHDEARSWLTRTEDRFQVIQMSLIDTWAATGAGAHALGENGLYTQQAWVMLLDRLKPGGIFTVSRWYSIETGRMIALATGALFAHGVAEPRRHVVLMSGGAVTTLLVGRDPISKADENKLAAHAQKQGFKIITSPSQPGIDPMLRPLATTSLHELEQIARGPVLDLRPPTDDRPFFFNVLRLPALWTSLPPATSGAIEGNLLATRTLGLALVASIVLVAGAIVVPLWRRARPRKRLGARLGSGLVYFTAIGIGFMLAEIAMLQRLSLVLGHPIYSLIVVLCSLVAAAGLGSLLSDRLPLDRAPWRLLYPLLLAGVLAVLGLGWSSVAERMAGAPNATRILFAIGCTAFMGIPLGMAFPAGMRIFRPSDDEESPWLWGMNGVGSVLASSSAILLALEMGLSAVMMVAAWFYLLLVPAIFIGTRTPRDAARDEHPPSPGEILGGAPP